MLFGKNKKDGVAKLDKVENDLELVYEPVVDITEEEIENLIRTVLKLLLKK